MRRPSQKSVRIAVGLLLFGIVTFLGYRAFRPQKPSPHFPSVTAELDAEDPRWRLSEIESKLSKLPEVANSAQLVPEFKAAMKGRKFEINGKDGRSIRLPDRANRHMSDENFKPVADHLNGFDDAIKICRRFGDSRRGFLYTSPLASAEQRDPVVQLRTVANLLNYDSYRLCREGKFDQALRSAHAILNAAQIIDGDGGLVAALIRNALDSMAVSAFNRCLALGEPKRGLEEIQANLLRESESDYRFRAIRGERAGYDANFEQIRAGKLAMDDFVNQVVVRWPDERGNIPPRLDPEALMRNIDAEHEHCLRVLTDVYELRLSPEHRQLALLEAMSLPENRPGVILGNAAHPLFPSYFRSGTLTRARLRCAAVGAAVERFRQAYGRWPNTLAEIPAEILAQIPNDPYSGLPVKFARLDDGVTVYCVGSDGRDNAGHFPEQARPDDKGTDIVFRLYSRDHRGLTALPTPKPDDED